MIYEIISREIFRLFLLDDSFDYGSTREFREKSTRREKKGETSKFRIESRVLLYPILEGKGSVGAYVICLTL